MFVAKKCVPLLQSVFNFCGIDTIEYLESKTVPGVEAENNYSNQT